MTIRLRPHHLLCMLTYVGKGYTEAFTQNYDAVVKRIGCGEDILIVAGPDDVCAPLVDTAQAHCFDAGVTARDAQAADQVAALIGCRVTDGVVIRVDAPLLARLREAFAAGGIRGACEGCEWAPLCDDVAQNTFQGTRLSSSV